MGRPWSLPGSLALSGTAASDDLSFLFIYFVIPPTQMHELGSVSFRSLLKMLCICVSALGCLQVRHLKISVPITWGGKDNTCQSFVQHSAQSGDLVR